MIENRRNSGNKRVGQTARHHVVEELLAIVSIFCLLISASCNNEKVSQAEARALKAEKDNIVLAGGVGLANAELIKQIARVRDLEAQVKAAEARVKAAPAVAAIDKVMETVKGVATKPATPATKLAAAVDPSQANAIRVHALAGEGQIAKENVEMAPVLRSCDKDGNFGLSLCVLPKQSEYSQWLPVLVTWNATLTPTEATALLGCLQNQPAVKKDKSNTNRNAAELALRSKFTGRCLLAPVK